MSDAKRIKLDTPVRERLVPVLPDDLTEETPLINVYVDEISDPRNISKVIVELNSLLPVPELNHLKRVRGKLVMLCPVTQCEQGDVHLRLSTKGFDVNCLSKNVKVVPVAQIPPKVRKQYAAVNKLWPCNFHSDKYLEKLSTNTLFSDSEIEKHERYMKLAINVSEYVADNYALTNCNGVVIVDPKIDSIVAVGYDNLESGPCQHAVMVGIDNVAKSQNGGAWQLPDVKKKISNESSERKDYDTSGISSDMLGSLRKRFSDLSFGATLYRSKSQLESPADGPYLCTGYYAYSMQEPCVMCAMALVHSRIKRVFYGIPSVKGGLGTLCKVHCVKDLNHHFEAFAGVLKSKCAAQLSRM